jgi:hypothetical protein
MSLKNGNPYPKKRLKPTNAKQTRGKNHHLELSTQVLKLGQILDRSHGL